VPAAPLLLAPGVRAGAASPGVRSEVLPLSAPLVPSLAPLADELWRHALVVASHFISRVFSQSAFVIGTGGVSAANAGAMKAVAAKSAISVFIYTLLGCIFWFDFSA
jgi:hypothetical protein